MMSGWSVSINVVPALSTSLLISPHMEIDFYQPVSCRCKKTPPVKVVLELKEKGGQDADKAAGQDVEKGGKDLMVREESKAKLKEEDKGSKPASADLSGLSTWGQSVGDASQQARFGQHRGGSTNPFLTQVGTGAQVKLDDRDQHSLVNVG